MPKMTVKIAKDATGFPSIVNITKNGRTMKVTTDSSMGFTIEGQSGVLPDYMEAFRVILPRVSYHKEASIIQAEENTEVNMAAAAYALLKTLGIQLGASHTLNRLILTFKTNNAASAATVKVTYETDNIAETTLIEESTNVDVYDTLNKIIDPAISEPAIIRLYLKSQTPPNSAYSKQLTIIGDTINTVGHLF